LGKAFMDAALVSLLATFCPPLLIAYCVFWATQFIPGDSVIKTTCSIIAGLSFTLIGGFFLEVLLVLGVFAIDLVTGKFLHHWKTVNQTR
jgi:hypothetical protein